MLEHMLAQKAFIEGVVYGNAVPLDLANVIILNDKDSSIYTFAITDANGHYQVEVELDSIYEMRVSYLGFEEWQERVHSNVSVLQKDVQLVLAQNNLEEVTVVYEMPVVVSGDTISYKTDAFNKGNERKLEDVLENLPGFQIDDNGQVKVNGEKVDKITVDGKEFFTGDTKMATKNIPANVVDKVNVLKNHSDVSMLRGLNDDQQIALDISLKEDKQNIIFGSIKVAGGDPNRYSGHTNIFYFNKKASLNIIGNSNNIGEQIFTFQDYLKFNGGIAKAGKRSGVTTQASSEELGLNLLKNNTAEQIQTNLGAFNFTFSPNKKINFSGFGILSHLNPIIREKTSRLYLGQDESELLESETNRNGLSGIAKLNTVYKPSSQLHVEHSFVYKHAQTAEFNQFTSNSRFTETSFDSDTEIVIPTFEQSLEFFYQINNKHITSLEVYHNHNSNTKSFELNTLSEIYPSIFAYTSDSNYHFIQSSEIQANQISVNLNHYWILNPTNHLSLTGGYQANKQILGTSLSQELDFTDLDSTIIHSSNAIDHFFQDKYLGLGFKSKFRKLTIYPEIQFHRVNLLNKQAENDLEQTKDFVFPNITAKYQFKKTTSLTVEYQMDTEFFDVRQFARNGVLQAYNNFFIGNQNINNAWYQKISLNYYALNLFNFTNFYSILTYQKRHDALGQSIRYDNLGQVTSSINIPYPNENISAYFVYDRRFKHFKIDLAASLSSSKYQTYVSQTDNFVENTNFRQDYRGAIELTIDKFPILEIGYQYILNNYSGSFSFSQQYANHKPFANLEFSFLSNFILAADYEYYFYKGGNISNSIYDILNVHLYYRKDDSPFEFKISCLNLFNTKSIRQDSFTDFLINTNEYFIQPRFVVGGLKYEF